MDKNDLFQYIESGSLKEILVPSSPKILQILHILKDTKFAGMREENIAHSLQEIISILTVNNDIFVAAMHVIFHIRETVENIDYFIPQNHIPYIIKKLQKEKYTQSFLICTFKFILNANNLAADAPGEEITPILFNFINDEKDIEEETVSYYAAEILGNITAYSFPKSFLAAFENQKLTTKVAIVIAHNIHSYSAEDKAKLLHIISDKLSEKNKAHAYLLAATLILIDEGQPFLFDYFKELGVEEKVLVLSKLEQRLEPLPVHEAIVLYSLNQQEDEIIKKADYMLDIWEKNSHKLSIENIKTWGDFREFMLEMIHERQETYKKSLKSYLSALVFILPEWKNKPLSIENAARWLANGFCSSCAEYNGVWELEIDVEDNTYEEAERILQEQITDLHRIELKGLLKNWDEEEPIEAPSGREWNNFNVFSYLDKATSGHEQSSVSTCRWDDISAILLMGRIAE